MTRIRAYATAGMRLLTEAEQSPIWQAVATALNSTGLDLSLWMPGRRAATLKGYGTGLRYASSSRRAGAWKMLEACWVVSIWVVPRRRSPSCPHNGEIAQDAYTVAHGSGADRLYSHSYMRYGQNEVRNNARNAGAVPRLIPLLKA